MLSVKEQLNPWVSSDSFFQRTECIWFNKTIRLKSKQYFYYDFWYEKGICTFTDLLYLDLPTPVLKSFDDHILEFYISYKDRKKYNSIIKSIVDSEILDDVNTVDFMGAFVLMRFFQIT